MKQSQSPDCQLLSGLGAVEHRYEAFLIDAWGVLHDGTALYPHALDCLVQLRSHGKPVIILSNAARRRTAIVGELGRLGIDSSLYHDIVSSGELTWCAIREDIDKGGFYGKQGYYLGPVRSRGLLDGLDLCWQASIQQADFILNAGAPMGNPADVSGCEALLAIAAKLELPMICANPDQVAIRDGQAGISAGAIATRYRQLGALVIDYHGKPYSPMYQGAMKLLAEYDPQTLLAVGDAFATDILGASNAGIDSWLIAGGIHHDKLNPLSSQSIRSEAGGGPMPTYASEYLAW